MKHPVLMSAVATAASLMGSVIVAVTMGALADRLPFHAPDQTLILFAMIAIFGGGALWGFLLTQIHGLSNRMGACIAGSLSFGLGVICAATLLLRLEQNLQRILVEQHRFGGAPIHIIFTLLFVPATFVVATIGGGAILLVSGNRVHWFRSALLTGLTASLSFLMADLLLDSLGMRVGAPRAAEHFTMLTVAFLGSTAAAFSGGAILGRLLSKRSVYIATATQ